MTPRTRAIWWGAATLLAAHAEARAQVARPSEQVAKPGPLKAAARPAGTARTLAALARFANGQLGDSVYDRRIAAALAKVGNAKAIARRIVGPFEWLGPADRAQVFPGVAGLDKLTTRGFERARADQWRDPPPAKTATAQRTVLAPDIPEGKGSYGLLYRGMTVHKGADADGTDEPVVYTQVFWLGAGDDPFPASARVLPETGTLGVANGASSGASAGEVWSSGWWPGGYGSVVLLSAVLEDNGDLAQRKEELNLLVALARAQAVEDPDPDRMSVLQRELEDALELLHLVDHQAWSPGAVQVRQIRGGEYDQMHAQGPTASPFSHRLAIKHSPRGADYTLYFDVPVAQVTYRTVSVTIKQLEALGPGRDGEQNQQADFGADVRIVGNTPGSATHLFPANKNQSKTDWTVERRVPAGSSVALSVRVWDREPPRKFQYVGQGIDYCGDNPSGEAEGLYVGVCPPLEWGYDINPLPDNVDGFGTSQWDLNAVYDLGSNILRGDIDGPAGTYTLTGTPGQRNQARIVVEVSQR